MAPSKDMRRPDLIIPYQEPKLEGDRNDVSGTLASTMPMVAMFTRNKMIGWAAVVFSIQTWLGESEETTRTSTTPGYFSVGMAIMSLGVSYLPLFLPPQGQTAASSGTSAPAPVPLA